MDFPQSFEDEKKSRAKLRELLIDQELRRHPRDYDYLLIHSPSQSLYLMVDPWQEMLRIKNLGSNEFVENQHEPTHITSESSSDMILTVRKLMESPLSRLLVILVLDLPLVCKECMEYREHLDFPDVFKDVGSGLENGAGKVAGHSQERRLVSAEAVEDGVVSELDKAKEDGTVKAAGHTQEAPEAEIETGLTRSKVNEVCKVVEVLKNDSSGSDIDWKTEAVTASPSGKTGGSSSKTTSLRKREDDSGDYESDFKRGRSET
ncbi:hypothetical protein C5167_016867 [Papaver somniferum]|uniref:Uncharacterized protein n=1 Tax=Papaver somniferum TaxID=3469 RepID=A0A4Y7IL35_PAPSO|nr:hypothetical protein C5167_016867 [Papaver somniferum]